MEKVNPDLAARDKQGRSYAACEFLKDRGYNAAPVSGVQTKVAVLSNGHSFVSGDFLDPLTH
jgi:hypothetical protein